VFMYYLFILLIHEVFNDACTTPDRKMLVIILQLHSTAASADLHDRFH
jgi:hypothetical protein